MGKIFKALEKSAQQDAGSKDHQDTPLTERFENTEHPAHDAPEQCHENSMEYPLPPPVPVAGKYVLDSGLVTALQPRSVESEQFRLLKNSILFPEKSEPPRCIMVTSSAPSEGKSFVAANLAVSMAQNIDEYVLLIDCDLRKPTIHKLFGLDAKEGLSEYLSNKKPLSSLLYKSFIDKLTILPGGTIPPNPSELLSSEQMRLLIQEVKRRYNDRYIIIDTPPPHLTSETSALARQVDGILLVVKQGKTQIKDVQNIIEIYGKQNFLGVVKNFSTRLSGYGYGYGKYRYGNYGGYGIK